MFPPETTDFFVEEDRRRLLWTNLSGTEFQSDRREIFALLIQHDDVSFDVLVESCLPKFCTLPNRVVLKASVGELDHVRCQSSAEHLCQRQQENSDTDGINVSIGIILKCAVHKPHDEVELAKLKLHSVVAGDVTL